MDWKRVAKYTLVMWVALGAVGMLFGLIRDHLHAQAPPGQGVVIQPWFFRAQTVVNGVVVAGVFAALARIRVPRIYAHAWAVWGATMVSTGLFAQSIGQWASQGYVLTCGLLVGVFLGGLRAGRDPVWLFPNARSVRTFTVRSILHEGEPILRVAHEERDGAWQFLEDSAPEPQEVRVVALEQMTRLDPSLMPLADLPRGWQAVRQGPGLAWERERIPDDELAASDEST